MAPSGGANQARRRGIRRLAVAVALFAGTWAALRIGESVREVGWRASVPATAWILLLASYDSETAVEELERRMARAPDDEDLGLWSCQRALLRTAMRRRMVSEDPAMRELAVGWFTAMLPPGSTLSSSDELRVDRLLVDPNPDVRWSATCLLARHHSDGEREPRVAAVLADPAVEPWMRYMVLNALLHRFVNEVAPTDPSALELIHRHLGDPTLGGLATRYARTVPSRGTRDPSLVAPLLARGATVSDPGAAIAAAWLHADAAQRPQVVAAAVTTATTSSASGVSDLALHCLHVGLFVPELVRTALDRASESDVEYLLHACAHLPEDSIEAIRSELIRALERSPSEDHLYLRSWLESRSPE